MSEKKSKFVIIDANAIIHRAWHALPPTMMTKDGQITNAVYGFTMILLRALKDIKPDYVACAFDVKGPTFRHKEYKEYKATRVKKEQELYDQIPVIQQVLEAFNIPVFQKQGFEADDIIATIAKKLQATSYKPRTIIVTGDMDVFQLVDENTEVYAMRKGISDIIEYDEKGVREKFGGLAPAQLVDYKALRGDPSDNIPGVFGIGKKGATELIKEFGSLENLYNNLDSEKIKPRSREILEKHKKEAFLSKKLATMITDVNIKFDLKDSEFKPMDRDKVVPLFQRLGFKSLMNRLPVWREEKDTGSQASLFASGEQKISRPKVVEEGSVQYTLVDTEQKFKKFFTELKEQKVFCFDTETAGFDPLQDRLLGIGFCWKTKEASYVVNKREWIQKLKPIFGNSAIKKIGQNIKFDIKALFTEGVHVQGELFDTMVASYLINPGTRQNSLSAQAFAEFGYQMQEIEDLIGRKGKKQLSLADISVDRVSDYCCEDADFTLRLVEPLTKHLKETNNLGLFEKIEMPLIPVLVEVEKNGVKININLLGRLSKRLKEKNHTLEQRIHKLAGTRFNIASPIQLKEALFEKLKISSEGIGRTKTGLSTAESELQKLKDKHKIIPLIIQHRELAKLISTYTDSLPKLISKKTGRLHTNFNQTITATGRLSSSDPNLQNIPIRTDLGNEIRKSFIAEKGCEILAADYSQIELRVVASLANDKAMLEIFSKNRDIHTQTAMELNNVKEEEVAKAMRRAAKTVNFGILYGMGAHGLSQREGIPVEKARVFIEKYFTLHKNIKEYLEATKEQARKHGYVETLFGRRRYIPEINSGVQQVRAAAERMAINHPVQGSAADLMKLAMIEIHKNLPKISPRTKMILQVHDELVFEVPEKEIKPVAAFVKSAMENVYKLRAPIHVDIELGDNWGEMRAIETKEGK